MSVPKCAQAGCNAPRHMGKPYCLTHYKETDNYSYGLDSELKKKMDAKLDPQKLAQAMAWMEQLSGQKAGGQSLHEFLKDGTVLCKAINTIKSGTIKTINNSTMPFKQMENIAAYLAACKGFGMKSSDEFMTKDLYENANMVIVVDNIHALGGLSRKVAGFSGPYIGVKVADENKRDFTPEQLNTNAAPSRQVMGSYGYQDETHNPVLDRQIIKNVSGHTASNAPSKQTQGSYGYQVDQNKNLDKIIKAPVNTPSMASKPHQGASKPAATATASAGGGKFCANCGAARADGAGKFCSGCGKPF
jgi:hypothetical protein